MTGESKRMEQAIGESKMMEIVMGRVQKDGVGEGAKSSKGQCW